MKPEDDLPVDFIGEEAPPEKDNLEKAAKLALAIMGDAEAEDDDGFSSLEGAFTSIENSEEFAGLEGDIDRHTPPAQAQASHVNEYGVKVRGAKRCQPLADDDEIHFSVNLGDD